MKNIFLLLVLVLTLCSCNKDEDTNKSVTDLLTNGIWKLSSMTSSPNAPFPLISDCEKDDLLVFKSGGTITFDEGAISCSGDQTFNETWLLSVDEKSITVKYGAYWTCGSRDEKVVWKIISLTDSTLIVQYTEDCNGLGGWPWEITITFKH